MATQRYISTSFWDDEWIQQLDPSEKLLYLYLMTNPLTNIAGVYKLSIRRMCFDTGFNRETVEGILKRFAEDGKAYLHGEYIIIPKWPKHQKWDIRKKIRDGIISELQEISKDVFSFLYETGYEFDLDLVGTTIIAKKNRIGISGSMKKRLIEKAGHKCETCGAENVSLYIHHIKPIKEGGTNSEENLQAVCEGCHNAFHVAYGESKYPNGNPNSLKGVPDYLDSDSDSDLELESEGDSDSEGPFSVDDDEEEDFPP